MRQDRNQARGDSLAAAPAKSNSGSLHYASFTMKNLPRLGDCAAIALIKIINVHEAISSETITASLSIIRDAFASHACPG